MLTQRIRRIHIQLDVETENEAGVLVRKELPTAIEMLEADFPPQLVAWLQKAGIPESAFKRLASAPIVAEVVESAVPDPL